MTESNDVPRTPAARQLHISNIVIEHTRFLEAFDGLGEFHFPVKGGLPSAGRIGALYGDSRAGKTFATKRYAKQFPVLAGETGLIMPVVYADMPMEGGGGARAILEALASALEIPLSLKMNNPALTNLILKSLVDRKVELLLLDEFEQVFRKTDGRLAGFGRGLIRKIANLGTLSIMCVGLEDTYDLLRKDPQVEGRGGLPYWYVRPYTWDSVEEQMEFRLLCDEFDRQLPFNNRSGLKTKELAYRLHWVTNGNIGRLKGLIEAAGALAINEEASRIEVDHFAYAYERRKPPGTPFNPFRDDMSKAPKPAADEKAGKIKSGTATQVFSKKPVDDVTKRV